MANRRIYVASSWRNPEQPGLVKLLREHGHEVHDFRNPPEGGNGFHWSEISPDWQRWSAREYRHALAHPIAQKGFRSDLAGMEWCNTCILLLPAGRSAHLEAGWCAGNGKHTVVVTRDGEEPELMALLANWICVNMTELIDVLAVPKA